MAKLADLLGKYLVEWPDGVVGIEQCNDGDLCADYDDTKRNFKHLGLFLDIADDKRTAYVTKSQYLAARDRIAANAQATKEAREIAHGDGPRFCSSEHMIAAIESEALPKTYRKLWKRAALAAFAGYCARPGMDAECAAEEAMFAADAFMNAMEKHLSSN